MRNKYKDICFRCGYGVEVGQGHFQRLFGSWVVQHAQCAIDHRGTNYSYDPSISKKLDEYRQFIKRRQAEATLKRKLQYASETGKRASKARKWLKERGHVYEN